MLDAFIVSTLLIGVTTFGATAVVAAAPERASCSKDGWVASWIAVPTDATTVIDGSFQPFISVGNQTYRMTVVPQRGGSTLRIHLTNRFRGEPIEFGHVTVGAQLDGVSIAPGSLREVTFGGNSSVIVPAGHDILSDPIDLGVDAFQPLSVSVYVPGAALLPTEHLSANRTSFYTLPGVGDRSADLTGSDMSLRTTNVVFVSGVDVIAADGASAVVAFGDSITEGTITNSFFNSPDPSVVDTDFRYTDHLQRRIDAAGLPLSVVNAGIGGNRIATDAVPPQFGISGLQRMGDDVIAQAGATDVIMLFGINDLAPAGTGYDTIVAAYVQVIDHFHAAGIAVHLATIMPANDALIPGVLVPVNPVRLQLNDWIRAQNLADSVVDFDAALRDPTNPNILNPAFRSPDNLHPNAAGYVAMSDAVDLGALRGCR
jgi:lysophospholipase L1-like esterase